MVMLPAAGEVSPYSVAAQRLIDGIGGTEYASQLSPYRVEIARAALRREIRPEEVDVIFGALRDRRTELVGGDPEELADVVQPPEIDEWTPAAILKRLPQGTRELDWMERQLPPRDRE